MIKVITNSLGNCDWVVVKNGNEVLHEGHDISPRDLVNIIEGILDAGAERVEVDDEQMEEGDY